MATGSCVIDLKVLGAEKLREAQIKLETMRLVLAPLSVKAGVSEEKLMTLLAETEKGVRAVVLQDESGEAVEHGMVPVAHCVTLPQTLTAENGAKALLIGEFHVEIKHTCSACYFHGAQKDCEVCGGDVTWVQKHAIPWDTIKDIYKRIVENLAA